MSIDLPKLAVVFGSVAPPQTDIVDLLVHLGCTTEVSSYVCLLRNFDKKYSPGGTYPILVDADGSISGGRGVTTPLLITLRVEQIRAVSGYDNEGNPIQLMRVSGRCWGEKIFRKLVTKTYASQKGEAIVKDLMDSYAGISHVRATVELVEDTDTTYGLLKYVNTPVMDILQYIAGSADKSGTIGFDFRVAPDAKFEFFPRNSKTSSVSLADRLEVSEYQKSIFRLRDKIFIYGAAEKATPLDKDANTESLTPADGVWTAWGTLALEGTDKIMGSYSIKTTGGSATVLEFTYGSGKEVNANDYPSLVFQLKPAVGYTLFTLQLHDSAGMIVRQHPTVTDGQWSLLKYDVGDEHSDSWEHSVFNTQPFDWTSIKKIGFYISTTVGVQLLIDNLFFNHARWSGTYGSGARELSETDEELHSDAECLLRAKALHDFYGSAAEYIKVTSDVIDYGSSPILAGDRITVVLPNESINGYYRVISVEYHFIGAEDQTLEMTLELGKEPLLIADYIYGLKRVSHHASRYKYARR